MSSFVGSSKQQKLWSGGYQRFGISDITNLMGEMKSQPPKVQSFSGYTVVVEGNIGCGKTTLLNYFENNPAVEVLAEPLHLWTNVKGHNALAQLYEDPKRWAFTFNTYVQLTRMRMHEYSTPKPVRLLERSLFSTRHVFVENSFRCGDLTPLEYEVLNRWTDWLLANRGAHIDRIVYLRADPEVCFDRIKKRHREEEKLIPFSFIKELHGLHERFLIDQSPEKLPAPVLVLDANKDLPDMFCTYRDRGDEIFGDHLASTLTSY